MKTITIYWPEEIELINKNPPYHPIDDYSLKIKVQGDVKLNPSIKDAFNLKVVFHEGTETLNNVWLVSKNLEGMDGEMLFTNLELFTLAA